ncbi:MAG: ester cyclase, partial [Lentilitoribacter sp.]
AGFWPMPPSSGEEGRWAGPITGDGIRFTPGDKDLSAASLEQTLLMQKSLGDNNGPEHFTREGLINMEQKKYWHPKMMWYGPSGIGTTRSLAGFVDYHQLPFRLAFPNRMSSSLWEGHEDLMKELNAGHYIRVGDGSLSVTGGWPSVVSPHDGEFLGSGATGKLLQMRVMDFYHHHEGLIRENWVPIDIIFLMKQMGVDVFQRMHKEWIR